MQCKAIQMSPPNTWPPQSWNQFLQAPPQPYHVHLPCELEALLTSDLWKYYTSGTVATGRYTSDSVSSDEGTLAYTSDDSDDNNNNNNTTNNLNNLTIPPEVSVADNNNNNNSNNNKTKNTCGRARVVDEDGFIRRAACLCVDETESKVLLVSSKKDRCSWLVPGGGVEAGEEESAAAVREAWEEAGVQGHTTRYLGVFETKHQSGRKKHRTAVFVVAAKQIHAHYPEDNLGRARQWFSIEDALLQLSHDRPVQSAYLQLLLLSRLKAAQE